MEPTRDNPLIRIKAFLDGLGVFTFFALVLLVIIGIAAVFGFFNSAQEPEDVAGDIRYETKAEIDKAQTEFLTSDQISAVVPNVSKALIASMPLAVQKPEQIVPGSKTAMKLADAPEVDTSDMDAVAEAEEDAPIDPAVMEIGKIQYLVCGACHGQSGEGVEGAGPPLAGSEWVTGPISNLIKMQLRGLAGPIEVKGVLYDNFVAGMAPMAYQTDEQIAGALTYIRNSFGNKASAVKPEQVAALRGEVGKPQITVEELIKP